MPRTLTLRQRILLDALAELSFGEQWVEADGVARRANTNANLNAHGDAYFGAVGVGVMLARLAGLGHCAVEHRGYMNVYKSNPEG